MIKFSDLVPKEEIEEGPEYDIVMIDTLMDQLLAINRIRFYSRDGVDKVFIGFTTGQAIATASKPIMEQCMAIRTKLALEDSKSMLPDTVEVTLKEMKSKNGRNYFIFV